MLFATARASTPSLAHLEHKLLTVVLSAAIPGAVTFTVLFAACRYSRLRWTWAPLAAPVLIALTAILTPLHLAALLGSSLTALLATTSLLDGERRDERLGGDHRRRARSKRGPLQTLRSHSERRRIAAGPHGAIDPAGRIALGTDTITRRPVWLHLDQLRKHTLILGATGSGKSNTLSWLTTRAIRAGFGAIVLDMKGDPHLRDRLQTEARLYGRPFLLFRIEDDADNRLYNPLRRGDATSTRDRLVAAQSFSDDFYRGLFASHAKVVLDTLDAVGIEPTITTLRHYWDPPELKGLIRRLPPERKRDLVRYLDRLPPQQIENLISSRARLDEIADTRAAARLRGGLPAHEIDLARAVASRAIVLFSINADSYPGAAAMLGNLILQDLVGLVGELRQARQTAHAVCAVDEFGMLPGEQLGRLLSTARDVDLPVLLAGQDLAQLRRVSEHFEAEVKANVCAVIAHRQSEPDSAEQIARICGTEEVVEQTQQIDRRRGVAPRRFAEPHDQTGAGSQHFERRFRIGPDEVKDLDTGYAALRTAHPAAVHLVRVYRCETSEAGAPRPG